jgi:hypothetical protein
MRTGLLLLIAGAFLIYPVIPSRLSCSTLSRVAQGLVSKDMRARRASFAFSDMEDSMESQRFATQVKLLASGCERGLGASCTELGLLY